MVVRPGATTRRRATVNLTTKKCIDYYFGGCLVALLKPFAMLLGAVLKRDHSVVATGDIVVIKMQGGGSLLVAAPALQGIRTAYPKCRMILITTKALRPFGETVNAFDEIRCIDDSGIIQLITSAFHVLWKSRTADSIIDLEVYSRLTGVLALATCARNRLGFYLEATFWRRGVYTHLLFFNRYAPVHFFYDQIALTMSAAVTSRADAASRVVERLPAMLHREEYVTIGPGCSDLAVERRLPTDGWVKHLSAYHAQHPDTALAFVGNAADRPLASEIIGGLQREYPRIRCENRCGELSLPESLSVVRGAVRYFGIDSALLHYARLFAVPSESFWGPVMPGQLLRPWADVEDVTHYVQLPCSPCVHVAETPPCRGNNACMRCLFDEDLRDRMPEWIHSHTPWTRLQ